jgi:hypothetical protein
MRSMLVFVSLVFLLAACDRPECTNTNPVFDRYTPASKEYKAELVLQMKKVNAGKLSYWIDKYQHQEGKDYMTIHVQGDGLCAQAIMDITNDGERFSQFKAVRGGGYHGAELRGLKFRIDSSGGEYNFVFESLNWIID